MNPKHYFFLCLTLASLLSGCKTFDEGASQEVEVSTIPAGATVIANGEERGVTPVTLELGRKISHRLVFHKPGYLPAEQMVNPTRSERSDPYFKVAFIEKSGAHNDLKPNPVIVELTPDFMPAYPGVDPYNEMMQLLSIVDSRRDSGQISAEEHRYLTNRVFEFYGVK